MKLDDAVLKYVKCLEKKGNTLVSLQTVRGRLGKFPHQELDLTEIAPQHISAHFKDLDARGLASATRAGYKSTHRAFWSWCLKNGLIKSNPSDILLTNGHRYSYEPVHSMPAPATDFQIVLNSLNAFADHRNGNARDIRDAAIVSLAIDCAKRRGEMWNLRRKDIEIALRLGERTRDGAAVYRTKSHGKTGPQNVVFFEETAVLLGRWLAVMPPKALYLFVNLRTGQRLHQDSMGSAFKRICEFVGVPAFRFQATRKRDVTDIIVATGDSKVGQMLAGHKDARTTQIHYNVVEQSRVEGLAAALSNQRRNQQKTDPLAADFFGRID